MIQIIAGDKGKGKTKYLLEKVNAAVQEAKGDIVYLDKNTRHMYELNNKIRLIDVSQFAIHSYDAFYGFLNGIISQDHDLETMYLDSFLSLAFLTSENMDFAMRQLNTLSEKFSVDFVLSVSEDKENLPESAQACVIIAL